MIAIKFVSPWYDLHGWLGVKNTEVGIYRFIRTTLQDMVTASRNTMVVFRLALFDYTLCVRCSVLNSALNSKWFIGRKCKMDVLFLCGKLPTGNCCVHTVDSIKYSLCHEIDFMTPFDCTLYHSPRWIYPQNGPLQDNNFTFRFSIRNHRSTQLLWISLSLE